MVAVPGKAVFAAGKNAGGAQTTLALALDAALVEQLTAAFGGVHYLDEAHRRFIENWEVESYRSKVAAGSGKPMTGKVAIVTGGAQGFGYGIAEVLAAEGADVVIADMNVEGAKAAAAKLGAGADGVAVNIADEDSVAAMIREVVTQYGGIDLFVANAGVLRAGSVKTLTKKDWDFVTNINYSGYFLCVKHAAPVMALQNQATGLWSDIVQVNSKSGLVGSNRNGAYAGSKFGTIGLTQSFALELVSDRIKVNSVCPGNFFDGPLWSDPERGLFVQYLNTGKVPGAKTVADVKQYYENQIPMRRGCLPSDVARAIIYAATQLYETGQAIPVSGGQVMLN
ncbi:3-phenylpropionate-dihydrodiol/cinnamic acid-dihydrodiol dehydrogenase [bioreactor metagenome]|uniref:3-phenylpropionate-dihydrodiol/cinnamic acid-dihydrodiol dehydrogenase n=1 Tax=bioreactor metagenome TaxID=1076179 RepID=A0A645BBD3_9ZZZZ